MKVKFVCNACGKEFEVERVGRGPKPTKCLACKAARARDLERARRAEIRKRNRKMSCSKCGNEFTITAHHSSRKHPDLCYDCARKEASRAIAKKATYDSCKILDAKTLASAAKKPKGVSDVRWRIELRRRMNAEYYSTIGEDVR